MMRALVALVLVLNLLFWAYARGSFDGWFGLSAHGEREPERLTRQVRPETLRVLPAASAASEAAPPAAATPASAPTGGR